jgi:hypothetical protein
MKSSVPATNRRRQQDNIRSVLTPELRQHIRGLKRGLVQCGYPLLDYLGALDSIVEALGTAERSAECLLADDPFEAWDKVIAEDERNELSDTAEEQEARKTAAPNVKKMITRPMRQQLVKAIERLDEYHGCLSELVADLSKRESFDAAVRFAEDLQSDRPLETAEARKKREEAEAEAGADADDDLDGL